jgi:hypothetical protein
MNRAEMRSYIESMKAKGAPVRASRGQLPELQAAGISEADLVQLGVEIVDESELLAETDLVILCASARYAIRPDNVYTVCDKCGGAIQHRPNLPAHAKKRCFKCGNKYAAEETDQRTAGGP